MLACCRQEPKTLLRFNRCFGINLPTSSNLPPMTLKTYMDTGYLTQRILALSEITTGNFELFHINLKRCNHLQLMETILPNEWCGSRIFCMFAANHPSTLDLVQAFAKR